MPRRQKMCYFAEHIRKTGSERLELEMTVTDPATLNGEWKFKLAYKRASGVDRLFHKVFDNDRSGANWKFLTFEASKTGK